MPVVEHWAFLDHAAVAPIPRPTHEAVSAWLEDAMLQPGVAWGKWAERLEGVRRSAARLLHARPDEVALIRNTTEGINLVAEGWPWQPGDNVVTPAGEFPSNLYPWMNLASRGVELRVVPNAGMRVDLDRLEAACDSRTRVVAASWVGYASGWRTDVARLAEVAHRHGGLLFLDAIQGLGAFPLDVTAAGVDFMAADGHKWLLGPEGAGLFYARREHLDRLRPIGLGWNSVAHAGQFDNVSLALKPSAARFEGGTYPMPGLIGLGASLDLLLDQGIANIAARILELGDEACRRLQAIGAEIASHRDVDADGHNGRSGIISFELPGCSPPLVRRECQRRGVVLNCRGGRLRISPHAYNNQEDIERLIAALEEISRTTSAKT
ncbi:MAG: aminotransferase class V-fold PLP-dependent enzyme [Pirellulales bacterium]